LADDDNINNSNDDVQKYQFSAHEEVWESGKIKEISLSPAAR
jgi:hypothetical protein